MSALHDSSEDEIEIQNEEGKKERGCSCCPRGNNENTFTHLVRLCALPVTAGTTCKATSVY